MEKSEPSPSLHPSVKELIKQAEDATQQSTSKKLYIKAAPPSRRSVPILEKKKQRQALLRKNISSEVDLEDEEIVLSMAQITELISHNPLVKDHKQDIQNSCKIVYGNEQALQEKIQEIQNNPTIGKDVSWQIALHPENFFPLAGLNICGLKNETYQRAQNEIHVLCDAIENFTRVVEHTRKFLLQSPKMELKRYEKFMNHRTMSKILRNQDHAERERGPLSEIEVMDLVKKDSKVDRARAQIAFWSKTVFGKTNALQEKMEDVLKNPAMGTELTIQIAEHSKSPDKLAGREICGYKNKARKNAEAERPYLVASFSSFVNVVQQAQKGILQNHQAKQEYLEPSTKGAASLHKQQDLSQTSHSSQHLQASTHHKTTETLKERHERAQSPQPRKAQKPNVLTLAH